MKCKYCGIELSDKVCKIHEGICKKNPKNKKRSTKKQTENTGEKE